MSNTLQTLVKITQYYTILVSFKRFVMRYFQAGM